jgi:hypothetical protein
MARDGLAACEIGGERRLRAYAWGLTGHSPKLETHSPVRGAISHGDMT